MSLKIFHTSDLHLGMKFSAHTEVQSELTEARFNTLDKLVNKANDEKCDLFVVAGDLFNQASIAKKNIAQAAKSLSRFEGKLVAVLPGNHDFTTPEQHDLWNNFEQYSGDNIIILMNGDLVSLQHYDLDVDLYPAPCTSKHSDKNAIGWIKEVDKNDGALYRIGIAHGSLEGVSPDFNKEYYPMTESELIGCGLDIWLMGHTHIQFPQNPGAMDKIFYSATPEPDGFDCTHEGKAWIIELDDKKKITPTSINTGTYRFLHDEIDIQTISALENAVNKYRSDDFSNTLLKLKITGRIPIEEYAQIPQILKNIQDHIFYLQENTYDLAEMITSDIINKEFVEDSFPHKLLTGLSEDEDDWEALQIAYDLINEVKR
ncbi:MAG: DNA repair exonuclease [Methanosarcinales archaeon]|nr:DNA repair exonuclease [Methanosarcinales archaeon]